MAGAQLGRDSAARISKETCAGSLDAGMQDWRRGRTCERPLDGAVKAQADTDAVVAQGQRAVTATRAARVRPTQHRGRGGRPT